MLDLDSLQLHILVPDAIKCRLKYCLKIHSFHHFKTKFARELQRRAMGFDYTIRQFYLSMQVFQTQQES